MDNGDTPPEFAIMEPCWGLLRELLKPVIRYDSVSIPPTLFFVNPLTSVFLIIRSLIFRTD
ncbi:hypothetical protein K239x_03370 [Planctomycetes bacterium K23_9]|uniref:Uncharacterized protein n=1 Tax=Stieleria marina TaxID=1930275 RepID=A0A517NMP1_9BACT|nr:hypothetical protein K239x_03370 [Planctomycetes bacterium K23_9]